MKQQLVTCHKKQLLSSIKLVLLRKGLFIKDVRTKLQKIDPPPPMSAMTKPPLPLVHADTKMRQLDTDTHKVLILSLHGLIIY